MRCLDTVARYLFYTFIIDFALEMLDLVHRIYEADESFRSLDFMVHTRLYLSQVVIQILLGTVVPIALLALTQVLQFAGAIRAKAPLCAPGCLTPDRHLRHALERRHRRPAFLQELSRLHHLQDGFRHARGIVGCNTAYNSPFFHLVGAGATPSAVAYKTGGRASAACGFGPERGIAI